MVKKETFAESFRDHPKLNKTHITQLDIPYTMMLTTQLKRKLCDKIQSTSRAPKRKEAMI